MSWGLSGHSLPYFETLTFPLVSGHWPLLMLHLSVSPDSQLCPPVPPHVSSSLRLSCCVPKCFILCSLKPFPLSQSRKPIVVCLNRQHE